MTWLPLLNETENRRFRFKLEEIAHIISISDTAQSGGVGLMDGECGIALFCLYYSRLTEDEKFFDLGHQALTRAFDAVNRGFRNPSFSAGLAGLGWTLEHLALHNFLETSTNELLAELDELMGEMLEQHLALTHFDYLHGALGMGMYFLARLEGGAFQAKLPLESIVDNLSRHARVSHDGAASWQTIKDYQTGAKGTGVSLSHGVASIIAFLTRLLNNNIAPGTVRILLNGASRFILNQRLTDPSFHSVFPVWSLETEPPRNSRMAWCYGDPGIACALIRGARSLNNKELRQQVLSIFQHAARRRDLEKNGVVDAGLCHGTCGLGHIFHRLYREEGDPIFKDAALYWFDQTLEMARFSDGPGGFKARYGDDFGGWVNRLDLLEGVSGIGLALISLISPVEPAWDSCMLLS